MVIPWEREVMGVKTFGEGGNSEVRPWEREVM